MNRRGRRSFGTDGAATAQSLRAMRDEEESHWHRLISLYRERFGEHIPLIRRQDVKVFFTANQFGWRPICRSQ